MSKTEELVKWVIARTLCIDIKNITSTDSIAKDLGADDLDWIEILINLEIEMDFYISDKEALEMETVKDITSYIEGRINDKT